MEEQLPENDVDFFIRSQCHDTHGTDMFRHQWRVACHTSVPQSLRGYPLWWTAPGVGGVSTGTVRSAGSGKTKSLEKTYAVQFQKAGL